MTLNKEVSRKITKLTTSEDCHHLHLSDFVVKIKRMEWYEATIRIAVTISNSFNIDVKGTIMMKLDDLCVAQLLTIAEMDSSSVEFEFKIKHPKLYSIHSPHLYDLQMTINSNLGITHKNHKVELVQTNLDRTSRKLELKRGI